jgi:hypothetical protein
MARNLDILQILLICTSEFGSACLLLSHAAARSSLSVPRAIIIKSGIPQRSLQFASSRGVRIQTSRSSSVVIVPRSPLNSVQMPANANSGRSSSSANQTTSFFFVSGFGSGAYSEKLLAGTRHRFSGFDQPRQCGDDVLRMLVTGGPPNFGGGGIPQRIIVNSRSVPTLRTTGAG